MNEKHGGMTPITTPQPRPNQAAPDAHDDHEDLPLGSTRLPKPPRRRCVLHAELDGQPFTFDGEGIESDTLDAVEQYGILIALDEQRAHHVPYWDFIVRLLGRRYGSRLKVLGIDMLDGAGVVPFTFRPPLAPDIIT